LPEAHDASPLRAGIIDEQTSKIKKGKAVNPCASHKAYVVAGLAIFDVLFSNSVLMRITKVAIGAVLLLALVARAVPPSKGQEAIAPTSGELAAITERGRLLYEYDQAAWHASDAVQMANPKNVEGQRYIAKKENGKWTVVFGKLNEDRSRFAISYEADEQATLRQFVVKQESAERQDEGFFLYAARAIELAMKDFGVANRPYNVAVLPAPADQLHVYLYPTQTKARVYPLGGDMRYLVSADGTKILEKRPMHKTIIETAPQSGKRTAAGFHTHVLSDQPEDTDVFHVLTQDPPVPEFVATTHFMYQVSTDGTVEMRKTRKRKK
jgi:hypothetical protein